MEGDQRDIFRELVFHDELLPLLICETLQCPYVTLSYMIEICHDENLKRKTENNKKSCYAAGIIYTSPKLHQSIMSNLAWTRGNKRNDGK